MTRRKQGRRRIRKNPKSGFERLFPALIACWSLFVVAGYLVAMGSGTAGLTEKVTEILELAQVAGTDFGASVVRNVRAAITVALAVAGMVGLGAPVFQFLVRARLALAGWQNLWWAVSGLAVSGLALLGLAFTGLLRPVVLGLGLLVAAGGGVKVLAVGFRERSRPTLAREARATKFIFILAAIAVLGLALSCLAPEIGVDSLNYHLGKTSRFLEVGRITAQPTLFYQYPPLWELILTPFLVFGGETGATLVTPLVVLLTAFLVWREVARISPMGGAVAASLFLTAHAVTGGGGESKNDLLTTLFVLAAFCAVTRARLGRAAGWAVAGGLFIGAALLTKPTALPALVFLTGLLFVTVKRARLPRERIGGAFLFITTAVVIVLPWLLRNGWECGNVFAPATSAWLGGGMSDSTGAVIADDFAGYVMGNYETIADKFRAVWSLAAVEGKLLLPALALPVLVWLLRPAADGFAWGAGGLFLIAAWALGPPQARFLLPVLPIIAIAIGIFLASVPIGSRFRRALMAGVVAVAALETGRGWLDESTDRLARVMTGIGFIPHVAYFNARLTSYAQAIAWANRSLPDSAVVLVYGDPRSYPLHRRFIPSSMVEPPLFLRIAGASQDPMHLARKIRQLGITHLFYNKMGAVFFRARAAQLRPEERAISIWAEYLRRNAELVYESSVLSLRQGSFSFIRLVGTPGPFARALLPGVEGWLYRVETHAAEGRWPEAAAEMERITRVAGDFAFVKQAHATMLESILPRVSARMLLKEAEAGGVRSVTLFATLARYAREDGEEAEAARYIEKAQALDPAFKNPGR